MQKPEVPSRHRQKRWKWANWAPKLETKTRKYQISQVKRPPSLGPAPQLLTKANKANKENPPPLITTNNTVKQNNWTKGWESMKNGNENGEKLTRSKCNT